MKPPPESWVPVPAAVFFDLGGVLVDVALDRSRDRWVAYTGRDRRAFDRAFFHSGLKDRLDIGDLSTDLVVPEVNEIAGLALTTEQVYDIWNACIVPRPDAFDLVSRVAQRARVGIISDTDPLHARFIREDCGLGRIVACWTVSYELGRKKPDPYNFVWAMGQLGVERKESLFIDDRLANVEAARVVGMTADVCLDVESLASILEQRGLV